MYQDKLIKLFHFIIISSLLLISFSHASDEHEFERGVNYGPGSFKFGEDKNGLYTRACKPEKKPQTQSVLKYEAKLLSTRYDERILKKAIPGKDGRKRVTQTKDWPHSIHTHLAMIFEDEEFGGSGSMVGPHHILTAAHNVFDKDKKVWAKSIKVYPALNDKVAPFGAVKVVKAYTFTQWTRDANTAYDMALLLLEKPVGLQTGWGGMMSSQDQDLKSLKINISGYPSDKGFQQLWTMEHKLEKFDKEEFSYEIDTEGGQSGSPIWTMIKEDPYIIGVHTQGDTDKNLGVRLSHHKVKQHLAQWIENTYEIKTSLFKQVSQPEGTQNFLNDPLRQFQLPQQRGQNRHLLNIDANLSPFFLGTNPNQFSQKKDRDSIDSEEDLSQTSLNQDLFQVSSGKNLSTLLQEVGFSNKTIKDETKLARAFLKKLCTTESKSSVSKSLSVAPKTLSNFLEDKEAPTILPKLKIALENPSFGEKAKEALETPKPKKRKKQEENQSNAKTTKKITENDWMNLKNWETNKNGNYVRILGSEKVTIFQKDNKWSYAYQDDFSKKKYTSSKEALEISYKELVKKQSNGQ